MKSPLEAPEKQVAAETSAKPENTASVIDTSKMSAGKAAALELAESSRDPLDERGSFASNLFIGRYDFDRVFPWPGQSDEDRAAGEDFLAQLKAYLHENVDADEIDRTGEIPQKNIDDLFAMGAFAIKVPKQYGGLGLSQVNYGRAAMLLGSWDANLTALVSAHQSIGVPQPLLIFGTEEQKAKYLPRVARKEISAFALTEMNAGSDPANMSLQADKAEDGSWVLNGEKLWCTNLIKAGVLVVMAKTPPKMVKGKERKQISAFIVDVDSPGLEITYRCHFMGLRALYNGIVKFTDVRVPRGESDREGRAGVEGGADHVEHRPADDSRGLRRLVEAAGRSLPEMGERTRPVGRADRPAFRDRREDRRDGGQHVRHGSDHFSHFGFGRSQGGRSADRDRHVQNVVHGNDLEDRR